MNIFSWILIGITGISQGYSEGCSNALPSNFESAADGKTLAEAVLNCHDRNLDQIWAQVEALKVELKKSTERASSSLFNEEKLAMIAQRSNKLSEFVRTMINSLGVEGIPTSSAAKNLKTFAENLGVITIEVRGKAIELLAREFCESGSSTLADALAFSKNQGFDVGESFANCANLDLEKFAKAAGAEYLNRQYSMNFRDTIAIRDSFSPLQNDRDAIVNATMSFIKSRGGIDALKNASEVRSLRFLAPQNPRLRVHEYDRANAQKILKDSRAFVSLDEKAIQILVKEQSDSKIWDLSETLNFSADGSDVGSAYADSSIPISEFAAAAQKILVTLDEKYNEQSRTPFAEIQTEDARMQIDKVLNMAKKYLELKGGPEAVDSYDAAVNLRFLRRIDSELAEKLQQRSGELFLLQLQSGGACHL